ncbi:MAG: four helix bundle protein [Verrucomicrobiota bacterium]
MTNDQFDLKQRTKAFALRVIKLFGALPKSTAAKVLGTQVLRSGTSVGANYHEADSARSRAEFIAKMGDSLKELSETSYWLELLIDSEIVPSKKLAPLLKETHELKSVFAAIIKKTRDRGESSN